MRKITGLYLRFAVLVLLMVLLAACGSKSTTTTASNPNPSNTYAHSVAFKSGSIFAWGANTYGQLGNNDSTNAASQTLPQDLSSWIINVSGASVGGTHTLAYLSDGTVKSWGNNPYGQVGDNTNTIKWTPAQVVKMIPGSNPAAFVPLPGIRAVSAGGNISVALDNNSSVWVWGDNTYGQLGTDPLTLQYRYYAGEVNDPTTGFPFNNIARIAAGGAHVLALTSSNLVLGWGYNGAGQLGYSTTLTYSSTPSFVRKADNSSLTGVVDFAAGGVHSLFVLNDGTVWACGRNSYGQLGNGTIIDETKGVVPLANIPAGTPTSVAAGLVHSLILINGSVYSWGDNFFGQLGNGAAMTGLNPAQTSPVPVKVDATHYLSGVTKIIAIGNHNLALDSNGQLWAWGENTFGQLGLGDTVNRNYATQVPSLSSGVDLYRP